MQNENNEFYHITCDGTNGLQDVKIDGQEGFVAVWWDWQGIIIHYEVLPSGQTLYSDLHMDRVKEVIAHKRPAMANSGELLFIRATPDRANNARSRQQRQR